LIFALGDYEYNAKTTANSIFTAYRQVVIRNRQAISTEWETYLQLCQLVSKYDKAIEQAIRKSPECKSLIQLEGVGPINAINLYLAIGCSASIVFKQG